MTKIDQTLLKNTEQFLVEQLAGTVPAGLIYHSEEHARNVVAAVDEIGRNEGLTEEQLILAMVSAWLHDIGFISSVDKHEEESARIARDFLIAKGLKDENIRQVEAAIMATMIPQTPKDKIAAVLCDADMYHLTTENYFELANLMREENKLVKNIDMSRTEFEKMSYDLFVNHQFQTEYGKSVLQKKKEANMKLLQQRLEKNEAKRDKKVNKQNKEIKKLQGKLEQKKGYSRGVESMFRLTARNQISLSSIADNKSNILISVNAIIMSVTMTVLVSRFEETPNIILPTLTFLIFCMITIVFAILSTRPNISSGTFDKKDIKLNKVNLLFFGNFYNMELDDYEWAIGELMKNDENLYSTMIKDQYSLGKVLAKKYKLLRIAYNVFMVGIFISVLTFVFAFITI